MYIDYKALPSRVSSDADWRRGAVDGSLIGGSGNSPNSGA